MTDGLWRVIYVTILSAIIVWCIILIFLFMQIE